MTSETLVVATDWWVVRRLRKLHVVAVPSTRGVMALRRLGRTRDDPSSREAVPFSAANSGSEEARAFGLQALPLSSVLVKEKQDSNRLKAASHRGSARDSNESLGTRHFRLETDWSSILK